MKIKNSIFENKQYFETFGKIHQSNKLTIMDAYRVNRLIKKLDELNQEYQDLKKGLLEKLGTPGEEEGVYTIEKDHREEFLKEIDDLINIEHNLETEMLPWPKALDEGFSPADLDIMEMFFDMEHIKNPKVNVNTARIPQNLRHVDPPTI